MKIIYIANARIPTEKAHGLQIMKMCEAFSDSKLNKSIKLELVVPQRFNYIKEDPFKYYGIRRNFKIKKLPCLDLIPLDKIFGLFAFWIQSLTFYFFVFFYLLFKKTDILYTRDKLFLFFTFFKNNLVYEAHSFPKNYFLYSLFFKKLKTITVITRKLKELFVVQGVPKNKILVAPDAVDLEMFDIRYSMFKVRKEFGLPQNKKIIGYIGRLETLKKEKGIDILIKAFKILNEQFDNLFLCIVGGPKERTIEYQKFVQKIGLEKKVNFFGQVKHNLIPKILKSFDILVIPYPWTEHYAFYISPLKLFEYMAAKRPIVASDLPSLREILNENNAILIKPDSSEDLARGIKKVLENKDLAKKISDRAFNEVQKHTWKNRAKRVLEFICQNTS